MADRDPIPPPRGYPPQPDTWRCYFCGALSRLFRGRCASCGSLRTNGC